MQFEVDSVFRQAQLAGANRGTMAYLSNFPFKGKTTLKVRCLGMAHERKINGAKVVRWRHFVSQILSCSYPFPFKECHAKPHLDSQQGENAEDPNLPEIDIETRRLASKRLPVKGDAMLSDAMEPDSRIQNIGQHVIEGRFSYLAGKKVKRVTKELQKYRGVRMPAPAPKVAEGFGTGEGRRRESTTAPTTIAPDAATLRAVVDLKQFVDAIQLLETGPREYDVTSVVQQGVDPGATIAGKVAMPLRALAKGLGRELRSRHRWLSTGEASTRHLMILDVMINSKHVYLLELERGSEQNSERFSVLGCSAKDGAAIQGAFFIEFAQMVVRHRGWPPEKILRSHPSFSHLRYARSSHLKKEDAPQFAKRLESNLIEPVYARMSDF
jgi:hypothetical protein